MPAMLAGVRPRFLILVALLFGLVGLALWLLLPAGRDAAPASAAPAPAIRLPAVITVATAIGAGEILQPADLAPIEWAAGRPPANAILAGSPEADSLVGAVTRRPLAAGELLVPGAVIAPGERGFLAAVVSPGNRAIAISVDATTSAGGLIWPGDRVDVILTQEISEDGVPLGQRVLSETILADARVLSTDQTLATATATPADAAGKAEDVVAGPRRVPATVTLEVTPEEAERVTVAGTLGRLHLTLRAVASDPASSTYDGGWTTQDGAAATWAGAVSPGLQTIRIAPRGGSAVATPAPAAASAPKPAGVRIYRGSQGTEG